jgi:hypothetical protein
MNHLPTRTSGYRWIDQGSRHARLENTCEMGSFVSGRRNPDLAGCHYEQADEEQRNFNFSLINRTLGSSGLEQSIVNQIRDKIANDLLVSWQVRVASLRRAIGTTRN